MVEAVKARCDPEVARTDPDAAIAWIDAEGDRITTLAVEAGFNPELARTDRAAAVRWYEGRGGDSGLDRG